MLESTDDVQEKTLCLVISYSGTRSHHFLLTTVLDIDILKEEKKITMNTRKDMAGLRNADMRAAFRLFVWSEIKEGIDRASINDSWFGIGQAMRSSDDVLLCTSKVVVNKPWIST